MADAIRTVLVRPPSKSGETLAVVRAAVVIVVGALLAIGVQSGERRADSPPAPGDLLPFQILFRDALPRVQRMFRGMQEGMIEAENLRARGQSWPTVSELSAAGIPPFAQDPGERVPYRWSLCRDGLYVNYLGVPAAADLPAFLVLIQEPDPSFPEQVDPRAPLDEQHHRLADGTLLHVSFWFCAPPLRPVEGEMIAMPFTVGWTQVLAGTATGK